MKPIYKALIFIGLGLIVVVGVPFGAFLYLTSDLTSGPEKYNVFIGTEATSPDGKNVATFYTISGGGAAGYVLTRLNVRPNHQKFKPTKESNDFVFELRHGQEFNLQWQGNNRLKVVYENGADTYHQLNQQDDVKIIYQAKTINASP